eukprot:355982-Chlamydomonas_euryale.AAC.15
MRRLPALGIWHASPARPQHLAYVACPPSASGMHRLPALGIWHAPPAHPRHLAYVACPPSASGMRRGSAIAASACRAVTDLPQRCAWRPRLLSTSLCGQRSFHTRPESVKRAQRTNAWAQWCLYPGTQNKETCARLQDY